MRRPSEPEGYVLRGGRAGAERLRLLNRVDQLTRDRNSSFVDRVPLRKRR